MSDYAARLTSILETEPEPAVGVPGEDVEYALEDATFRGYVARSGGSLRRVPGVLVLHGRLGVTDDVRMRCDMLGTLGYAAFAADL